MSSARRPIAGSLDINPDGAYVVRQVSARHEPKSVSAAAGCLILINVFAAIGGLGLLGASAYAFINFNALFAGLLSQNGIIGGLIAGLLIALVSVLGIFGTVQQDFRSLAIFTFVQFSLLVVILSVLGLFVTYINTVSQVAAGNIVVWDQDQISVNDFFLSAYTTCCVNDVKECNSNSPCAPVAFCVAGAAVNASLPCYAGSYTSAENPPIQVFPEFCSTLLAGGVVGPVGAGTLACGGGDPHTFLVTLFAFVQQDVLWCYYAVGFLAAILFIEVVTCVYLMRFIWRVEHGLYEGPQVAHEPPTAVVIQDEEHFEYDHHDVRERYQSMNRDNSTRMSQASGA